MFVNWWKFILALSNLMIFNNMNMFAAKVASRSKGQDLCVGAGNGSNYFMRLHVEFPDLASNQLLL